MVLYSFSKISEEVTCKRKRNFLNYKNILADKQFECRITTQNKAFFISKEELLSALSNEMHIAAISRHLAKAFHCLNNVSQKSLITELDNSLYHTIMTEEKSRN
jgi:hypothetical protein